MDRTILNEERFDDLFVEAKRKILEAMRTDNYDGMYLCGLHNELFNVECYYTYKSDAKRDLEEIGVFDVIELIKEYEQENFGFVETDFSNPCNVGNMLWYIMGDYVMEQLFDGNSAADKYWEEPLTEEIRKEILQEMEENEVI